MRIVGGRFGGLRFRGPPDQSTRPTAERVREGLASVLEARDVLAGATVLDLFAGTGALSFEALSRGAARAVAVEREIRAVRAMIAAAKKLGVDEQIQVLKMDLFRNPAAAARRIRAAQPCAFDLVFIDPPYRFVDKLPPLLEQMENLSIIGETTLVVIEHPTKRIPRELSRLSQIAAYHYGDTSLVLLRRRL